MNTLDHQADQVVAAWRRIHAINPARAGLLLELLELEADQVENPEAAAERDRLARARVDEDWRRERVASQVEEMSDAGLRTCARIHRVRGRSKMSRAELVAAIQRIATAGAAEAA